MHIRLGKVMATLVLAALAGCGQPDWGLDHRGEPIAGETLQGRWKVLNYWAEWCGPCRTEIPELNALAASADDVLVLGVNFDGLTGQDLATAVEAMDIDFSVLQQDPAQQLGIERSAVLPVTYLIDGAGKVRETLVGEQTEAGIRARLAALE